MPQRGVPKRSIFESSQDDESDASTASTNVSTASTVVLRDSDDGHSPGMPMKNWFKNNFLPYFFPELFVKGHYLTSICVMSLYLSFSLFLY